MNRSISVKNLIFTLYVCGLIVLLFLPSVQSTVPFYIQVIYAMGFVAIFFVRFWGAYQKFLFYTIFIALIFGILYFFITKPLKIDAMAEKIVWILRTVLPCMLFIYAVKCLEGKQQFLIFFAGCLFVFVAIKTGDALINNPLIARELAQGVQTEYLMSFRKSNVGGFSFCYVLLFIVPLLLYVLFKVKSVFAKVMALVLLALSVTIMLMAQYATLILLTIVVTMLILYKMAQKKSAKIVIVLLTIIIVLGLSNILEYISAITGSELLSGKFDRVLGFLRGDVGAGDISSRVSLIREAFKIFLRSPIFGSEQGTASLESHSTFFGLLALNGIIGMVAYYATHFMMRKMVHKFISAKSKVVWDCLFFGLMLLSVLNPIFYLYELFIFLYLIVPLILRIIEHSDSERKPTNTFSEVV